MMEHINQQLFTGERALFKAKRLADQQFSLCGWGVSLKGKQRHRTRQRNLSLEISFVVFKEHYGKQHHFGGHGALRHLVYP